MHLTSFLFLHKIIGKAGQKAYGISKNVGRYGKRIKIIAW